MTVTRQREKQHTVVVDELLYGAVFESNGNVYMRIFNARLDSKVRAVNVENGREYIFEPDVKVTPLEAELIIRGEYNAD